MCGYSFQGCFGIGDLEGITELEPLYAMDDLTGLWLVNTQNMDAAGLDLLLDNLATIEGTVTEGVLHMTQADFDALNTAGGGLLATWDNESGHHVDFVVPGDFDFDGDVDGGDFLAWQRGKSSNPPSQSDLDDWRASFGAVASSAAAASTGVPEPATWIMLMLGMATLFTVRRTAVSKPIR
jgi:hypothetical protein